MRTSLYLSLSLSLTTSLIQACNFGRAGRGVFQSGCRCKKNEEDEEEGKQ